MESSITMIAISMIVLSVGKTSPDLLICTVCVPGNTVFVVVSTIAGLAGVSLIAASPALLNTAT